MSHVTVMPASGSGQTAVNSGANLVTQIARIVGGESEAVIRTQALDCLNRVRIELNQHDWRFMKTTDEPITLSDGTATYSLERTFRKPSTAMLVDSAADNKFNLEYIDDEVLNHWNPAQGEHGQPGFYFLRNDFQDGYVTLFPTPDTSTANNYRLVVEYYARIEEFADTEDEVALPEEATNPLVIGGQAYILRERDRANPMTVQAFADYQRVKMLLLTDDRRLADERARFRMDTQRRIPFGTTFVKI